MGEDSLAIDYASEERALLVIVRLRGAGVVELVRGRQGRHDWRAVLSTEDRNLALDPRPISVVSSGAGLRLDFARPGAVVLEGCPGP